VDRFCELIFDLPEGGVYAKKKTGRKDVMMTVKAGKIRLGYSA